MTRYIKIVLVEVYRSELAAGEHKKTAHYQIWRDTVVDMMAEPRSSVKYSNVFPMRRGGDKRMPSAQMLVNIHIDLIYALGFLHS